MIPPVARIIFKGVWVVFLLICVVIRHIVQRRSHPTRAKRIHDAFIWTAWVILAIGTGAGINEDIRFLRWYQVRPKPFNNSMEDMVRLDMPFLHSDIRAAYVGLVFIYYTVLWCVKGAFIALYFDVFTRGELQKKYVVGLWALAAWTFAAYVTLVLYFSMLCTPIQRNWDLIPKCSFLRSNNALDISFSANVLTDMPLMAFPFFIIRKLQMCRRQKFGFAFVFSMGVLTITMATVRFVEVQLFKRFNVVSSNRTEDYSNRNINLEMWGMAEQWAAIFAVCLPAFRVYLRRTGAFSDSKKSRDVNSPTPIDKAALVAERRWDSMGFEKGILRTVCEEEGDESLPEVVPGQDLYTYMDEKQAPLPQTAMWFPFQEEGEVPRSPRTPRVGTPMMGTPEMVTWDMRKPLPNVVDPMEMI